MDTKNLGKISYNGKYAIITKDLKILVGKIEYTLSDFISLNKPFDKEKLKLNNRKSFYNESRKELFDDNNEIKYNVNDFISVMSSVIEEDEDEKFYDVEMIQFK